MQLRRVHPRITAINNLTDGIMSGWDKAMGREPKLEDGLAREKAKDRSSQPMLRLQAFAALHRGRGARQLKDQMEKLAETEHAVAANGEYN